MGDGDGVNDVHVILARLEGKLDANLAAHGGDIANLKTQNADHEARIRTGEKEINRLGREIERVDKKPMVTPKQLWAGFTTAAGAGAALAAIFKFVIPS